MEKEINFHFFSYEADLVYYHNIDRLMKILVKARGTVPLGNKNDGETVAGAVKCQHTGTLLLVILEGTTKCNTSKKKLCKKLCIEKREKITQNKHLIFSF